MARGSSLTQPYLETTADPATRYTPATWLKYTLRGKAARYSGKYARVLLRSLRDGVERGTIMQVPSVRGGRAYVRVTQGDSAYCWPCSCCGVPIPGDGSMYHPGTCDNCWQSWREDNPAPEEEEED
jgi:hypothetical protein